MNENVRRATMIRSGGRVERAHGIPHQGSYSNASHQWGVAMLMHAIWPLDFPRLALHCLTHDVPEAWVGDIPSPTLRYVPGMKEQLGDYERKINLSLGIPAEQDLDPEDYQKLKACDRIELYLWALEQQMIGNRFVDETLVELEYFFRSNPLPVAAQAFLAEVRRDYTSPPRQSGVMRDLASEQSGQSS